MFCVRCGREGSTYESLCVECFLENTRFTSIGDHVDLFTCYHCKEFQLKNKWKRMSLDEAIREAASDAIVVRRGSELVRLKMDVIEADPRNYHVNIVASVEHGDLKLNEELHTIVRLKNTVCLRCSKIIGNYYESIIQIRGRERKLSEGQKERIYAALRKRVDEAQEENREMFISKLEEVPGGFDAYLSSISLAKSISKELGDRFGGEVKESSTLVTQKDGKDVYRVTYLVRLPSYLRGEVVLLKGKPHLVMSIASNSTKLLNLKTHEALNMPNADLYEVRVLAHKKDILDAVVLSETAKELQVMHPVNFSTIEVRKPPGFKHEGETVKVVFHEEETYLVPG
jgi:nonsense-mediated mRNA decay protein 3